MDNFSETTLLDEAILEEVNEFVAADKKNAIDYKVDPILEVQHEIESLNLKELPKEFKKPLLENFDKRFILSLILSFAVHILIVIFIPRLIPDEFEKNVIQKLHQDFVNTILEENVDFGSSGKSTTGDVVGVVTPTAQANLTKIIEEIIAGIALSADDLPDFTAIREKVLTPKMIKEMRETLVPTAEEKADVRKRKAALDGTSKNALAKKVENIGLLGVITQGTGFNYYDYIADIIENADQSAENLEKILKRIQALQVPRYQRPTAWLDNKKVAIGLKTGRIKKTEDKKFYKNVQPLAKIEQVPIARNVDIDMLGSPLAGLNRRKAANGKYRSYKHISKIVASHSRVIQDCYKQILKHQPGLKGKMIIKFSIDTNGRITNAEIINSTLKNPKIERCVLKRVLRWNNFGPCDPKLGVMTFRIPYKFGS